MLFAPREELHDRLGVRRARVLVPYSRGEELYEPPGGRLTRASDCGRQRFEACPREVPAGDWDEFAAHRRGSSSFLR